jgi:hypothetical protein
MIVVVPVLLIVFIIVGVASSIASVTPNQSCADYFCSTVNSLVLLVNGAIILSFNYELYTTSVGIYVDFKRK